MISTQSNEELIDLEPYIAEWCVAQYPRQLSGISMTDVQKQHVKLEPALGAWCFAQVRFMLQNWA